MLSNYPPLNKRLSIFFHRKALKKMACIILCILAMSCSSDFTTSPPTKQVPYLNTSDSLAMVNIYKTIGPWGDEWDLNDIKTWGGVEIALDLDFNEYRIVGFQYYFGRFHGYLPEDFRKLKELRKLAICGGTLSGNIPSWIGELTNLQYLAISDNNIGGEIPKEIGNLVNLQKLMITNNFVSGTLPESLGNLKKVYRLSIYGTNIEGEIPKSLANMTSAIVMDLNDNQLTGRFPIEILTNTRLHVDCSNNNIIELPFEVWKDDFVGSPPNLQENMLSGEIPEFVFKTEKWKNYNRSSVSRQKEGFGYSNYK